MKNSRLLLGVTFALGTLVACQKEQDAFKDADSSISNDLPTVDSLPAGDSTPSTAKAVASVRRILIDMGASPTSKDKWGKTWNTMNDARKGLRVNNAVTTTNAATTLKLEVVNPSGTTASYDNGLRASNTEVGDVGNDYPASATNDNAFTNVSVTNGRWKVYGLTATSTYTIKFWGSYKQAGNRFVQVKRADETTWKEFNSANNNDLNTNASFSFTGKTEMSFDIKTKAGSNFGYISVVDISESISGTANDADPTDASGSGNRAPVANAGTDMTITLPTNSVKLNGSGTDADGTIKSYKWARFSGPSAHSFSNINVANPTISGLVAGTYKFRLTVTDNAGAIGTDEIQIVVNAAVAGGGTGTGKTLKFDAYKNAYYPNGTGLDWKPGDTIYVPAGNYGLIDLGNIRGTAAQPIIITNRGGQVVLNQVRFNNKMEHFKFLGNGTPGITYGFKIDQQTEEISFAATTVSNMEVAYVEVSKGAVGMMIKKNPVAGDASTQYGAYTIRNIKVHHCYIHDTKTEGMYIGSTTPSGTSAGIPIRLENVEVAFNKLDRTGWDGIQMSTTLGTNSIHDNVVTNFGTLNVGAQQTGIAIGSAATGEIYNNTITNGTGWGINCMGFGTLKVYNNMVDGVGKNGSAKGAEGIYADDRIAGPETFPKQQMIITGNTIRNPQPKGAIRVGAYTNNSLPSTVSNNKIYLPNAPGNWLTLYVVSNALGSLLSNNVLILQ